MGCWNFITRITTSLLEASSLLALIALSNSTQRSCWMWRLKINLILKCRFLCIRRYLIVVIFLNWFFSFKLFFIVVKGTVKFNIYRRFINLFKKIEMVMHHLSFFLFLLCAILLIYTMGHKTRNWKTNLESGFLRWTCIFSLTFMTTLHLQSRYIARISFLIYIKVNFYYKSW